jgi:predicted acyl esterase
MGLLRVSELEPDEEKSTPWQPVLPHKNPQAILANEIVPVNIEILPSSMLLRAGGTVQLVVQVSDRFEHRSFAQEHSNEVNLSTQSI